jgi:hypothetical protein
VTDELWRVELRRVEQLFEIRLKHLERSWVTSPASLRKK